MLEYLGARKSPGIARLRRRAALLVIGLALPLAAVVGVASPAWAWSPGYSVTASIPVGSGPDAVAADPEAAAVFVANNGSGTVSVISEATDTVTATITVGSDPAGVAVDPDTGYVFVSNAGSGTVSVISAKTDTVTATITVGGAPTGIAVDPDTGNVYVVGGGELVDDASYTVTEISESSDAVTATITLPYVPLAVAADPGTGDIWVTDGQLVMIDEASNAVTTTAEADFAGPVALAADSGTGTLYVANSDIDNVAAVSESSDAVTNQIGTAGSPSAIAADPATGVIYAASAGANDVSLISAASQTVLGTIGTGGFPTAVAVDQESGLAFVANQAAGTVSVIAPMSEITVDVTGSQATGSSSPVFTQTSDAPPGVTVTGSVSCATVNGGTAIGAGLSAGRYTIDGTSCSGLSAPSGYTLAYVGGGFAVSLAGQPGYAVTATIGVGSGPMAVAEDPVTGTVFVANSASGTVSVINEASDKVTATITVGSDPDGIAADPDTGTVYVVNAGSGTVSVISEASDTVTATINVPNATGGIAVDPSTGNVFVPAVNRMAIISSATQAVSNINIISVSGLSSQEIGVDPVTGNVWLPNAGGGGAVMSEATDAISSALSGVVEGTGYIAVDPLTGTMYVPEFFGTPASVAVVDEANDTVTTTIPVGKDPVGMAADPVTGTVYVSNNLSNDVSVIDAATDTVTATVGVGGNPYSVAVDPDTGNAFVANSGSGTVSVISQASTIDVDVTGSQPYGSASPAFAQINDAPPGVTVTGNVSCGTVNGGTAIGVSLDPGRYAIDGSSCSGLSAPAGYTLAYVGGGFAVNMPGQPIYAVTATIGVGSGPYALAADPDTGTVFVANLGSGTVSVISEATNSVVATVPVPGDPDGLAVDPQAGLVFVANGTSTVTVINALTNAISGTIADPSEAEGIFAAAADPDSGTVYAAGANDLSAISEATQTAGGPLSVTNGGGSVSVAALAVDPATRTVWAPYQFGAGVSVISEVTNAVTATITADVAPLSGGIALDAQSGTAYLPEEFGSVAVVNAATDSVTATIPIPGTGVPTGATVDPVSGTVYVSNFRSNTVSVISEASDSVIATVAVPAGAQPQMLAADPVTGNVYVANDSGTVSVISPLNPITVDVSGSQPLGSSSPVFTQTSNAPSGLSLSGTVSCGTVNGGTAISSALAVGTYSIDASSCSGLTAPAGYAVTYLGGSFNVNQIAQSISFSAPTSGTVGGSTTLSATGGASGNPVVFTVDQNSGAGVCSVSGTDGTTLSYTGAGSCVIDANQAGNADYEAAPTVTTTIPVSKAAQSISFSAPASGTVGGSATLTATGGASGNPVVFTVDHSSGAGVCSVSGANGSTVSYTAAGSCVIDANQAGNASYSTAPQVTQTIAVGPGSQSITFNAPASGTVGQSVTLSATGGASGDPVVFTVDSTSGAGVCSVSGTNGSTLSYTAAGTCVIDANQGGTANYTAAPEVQATITVNQAPTFVLDSPPLTATAGQSYSYTFEASGTPAPAYALATGAPSWLSVNASTGQVTGTVPSGTTSFSYAVTATNTAGTATAGPYTVTVTTASTKADIAAALTCPASLTVGSSGTCTLTVSNAGPATATKVVAAVVLPAALSETACSSNCTRYANVFAWTLASLASGKSATFTITVKASAAGKVLVLAAAASQNPDPNPLNNISVQQITIKR